MRALVCADGAMDACYEEGRQHLGAMPPAFDLSAAADRFDQACKGGHLGACVELGRLVQHGRGISWDPGRAVALYERACAGGEGVGCLHLGLLVRQGSGAPLDEPRAQALIQRSIDLLREGCEGGRPQDCVSLGSVLESGFGVTLPDPIEAGRVYERGCAAGEAESCADSSRIRLERASGDIRDEIARIESACETIPRACGLLGQLSWNRRYGLPRDPERATRFVRQGCERGDGPSCVTLGTLLGAGEDLPAQPEASSSAYQRACWLGESAGCLQAAKVALARYEVAHDPLSAKLGGELLGTACRIGDASGCRAFGLLVREGALGPPDPGVVLTAFTEACRLLEFDACAELAAIGAPLPLVEPAASEFLAGACERGLAAACVSGVSPDRSDRLRGTAPSP